MTASDNVGSTAPQVNADEAKEGQTSKGPLDVEYDPDAQRDAEDKMHAHGTGNADNPDPTGGHDPKALEEAARRMGVKR